MELTKTTGLRAIYGGLFLGGGGGGSIKDGTWALSEALKHTDSIQLKTIDELKDDELVVTASMVGSPASTGQYVDYNHWQKVYEMFKQIYPQKISGFITNENGGMSTTNGWLLSAVTGIPVVDAPCNGRAHPTGTMGSIGLTTLPDYTTIQTAAGGKGDNNIALFTQGGITQTSKLVRSCAVEAGGLVCVLRNPIDVAYVKKNAALNSLAQAVEVGNVFTGNEGYPDKIISLLEHKLEAKVLCKGKISSFDLKSTGGFDVGFFSISCNNSKFEVTFWNEYMTAEQDDKRLATFPDLIATLDSKTGIPKTSAELKLGDEITVLCVPKKNLILGSGMFDKNLYKQAEDVISKELVKYSF